MKKYARRIIAGVAVLIGIVGATSGLFENPQNIPWVGSILGDRDQVTTFLLGFLITFAAVEMAVVNLEVSEVADETLKNTQRIGETLQKKAPLILASEDDIYKYASAEVAKAQRIVRAVTFREEHRQDEPDYWEALSRRMKVKGDPIEYRHIYGYLDTQNVMMAESYHRTYFAKRGLEKYWKPRFLQTSSGVDMLIIDNTCVIISLPVLASDDSLRRAVVLPAVDGLAYDVALWFDDYLAVRAQETISL